MAAEVYQWLLGEDNKVQCFDRYHVNVGDRPNCISGFGDSRGGETYVEAVDDKAVVFIGEANPWTPGQEGPPDINVIRNIAELAVGKRHQELLSDTDGQKLVVSVRNIGDSETNPKFN